MDRPIRRSELQHLLPIYLNTFGLYTPLSPENLESGLAWALTPVVSHVALIREDHYTREELDNEDDEEILRYHEEKLGLYDEPGWVALDYIVSATDTPGGLQREIPDRTWQTLAAVLTPPEIDGVGMVAAIRDKVEVAQMILRESLDHFSREACLFGFGHMLDGEYDKAERIYIEAIDSGDPHRMSEGHAHLGMLLESLGEADEAIAHLSLVTVQSTISGTVGTLALGVLLQEERSDYDGAEEAFRKVVEHGDNRLLTVAAGRLAWLRARRKDHAGVIEICRRGLALGEDGQDVTLLFFLAVALREEGRLREAEPVAVQAANFAEPEFGAQAWGLLSEIREDLGDLRGSLRACEKAMTFTPSEEEAPEVP
jgi:tetratricopeptide (TPR) repeat protein